MYLTTQEKDKGDLWLIPQWHIVAGEYATARAASAAGTIMVRSLINFIFIRSVNVTFRYHGQFLF